MIVRYWMTPSPHAVAPDADIVDAHALMHRHDVRRLPVVDGDKLVGIICQSDLYCLIPPGVAAASITGELEARLEGRTVRELMTASPATCGPNDPMEEVGERMRSEKVGALPVLDRGAVVGIITESDVLAALAAVARAGTSAVRLSLRLSSSRKERLDVFSRIANLARDHDVEILTLLTHKLADSNSQIVTLRVRGTGYSEFLAELTTGDFQLMLVQD